MPSTRMGRDWQAPPQLPQTALTLFPMLAPRTFQRRRMTYFLSSTWDLSRRLQRLAFSARLLSQGCCRHWPALIRPLGVKGAWVTPAQAPLPQPPPSPATQEPQNPRNLQGGTSQRDVPRDEWGWAGPRVVQHALLGAGDPGGTWGSAGDSQRPGQGPVRLIWYRTSGDAAGPGAEGSTWYPGAEQAALGMPTPGPPWLLPASHLFSLMMRFETKSLASSETLSKVSSSKYQLAARTLLSVSVSLSPKKGERPLSLGARWGEEPGALRLRHLPNPQKGANLARAVPGSEAGWPRDERWCTATGTMLCSCLQLG